MKLPLLALVVLVLATSACREPPTPLIERLAEIEHLQWMQWSKSVADEVSPERRERWARYWVPYAELPEDIKELDRAWARKVLAEVDRGSRQ
ncbi:MAG: hypothetical protein K0V04_23175 [Deltaproteobacteria bacterium]|nr:hypothetical protein [Deltaproteobacteria bacterium]